MCVSSPHCTTNWLCSMPGGPGGGGAPPPPESPLAGRDDSTSFPPVPALSRRVASWSFSVDHLPGTLVRADGICGEGGAGASVRGVDRLRDGSSRFGNLGSSGRARPGAHHVHGGRGDPGARGVAARVRADGDAVEREVLDHARGVAFRLGVAQTVVQEVQPAAQRAGRETPRPVGHVNLRSEAGGVTDRWIRRKKGSGRHAPAPLPLSLRPLSVQLPEPALHELAVVLKG